MDPEHRPPTDREIVQHTDHVARAHKPDSQEVGDAVAAFDRAVARAFDRAFDRAVARERGLRMVIELLREEVSRASYAKLDVPNDHPDYLLTSIVRHVRDILADVPVQP
jgi:hypothetical protein